MARTDHNLYYQLLHVIDFKYLSSQSHTNSGTLVLRRTGFDSLHSLHTQTVCTPLSGGGSTTAGRTQSRTPPPWAPGSGLLVTLEDKRRKKFNNNNNKTALQIKMLDSSHAFSKILGVWSISELTYELL